MCDLAILCMFNHILLSLANCKINFSNEHNVVILLNSLPEMCKDVKNVTKYDCDTLIVDIVVIALRSKDLELKSNVKMKD